MEVFCNKMTMKKKKNAHTICPTMSSTLGLCSIAHLHNGSRLPSLPHSNLTVPARVSLKFFYAQKSAPVFSVNAHE